MATIACASCGQSNPASRKFCGQCGAAIVEPCIRCGVANPVDEKFCGDCGQDVTDALAAARAELQSSLDFAAEKVQSGQFLEAANYLERLSYPDHSQLRNLVAEVEQRAHRPAGPSFYADTPPSITSSVPVT